MLKVYTRSDCSFCVKAKQYLKEHNVPFEEINIDYHPYVKEWLINEGHRQVPQIYDGDKLIEGGYTGLLKLIK